MSFGFLFCSLFTFFRACDDYLLLPHYCLGMESRAPAFLLARPGRIFSRVSFARPARLLHRCAGHISCHSAITAERFGQRLSFQRTHGPAYRAGADRSCSLVVKLAPFALTPTLICNSHPSANRM